MLVFALHCRRIELLEKPWDDTELGENAAAQLVSNDDGGDEGDGFDVSREKPHRSHVVDFREDLHRHSALLTERIELGAYFAIRTRQNHGNGAKVLGEAERLPAWAPDDAHALGRDAAAPPTPTCLSAKRPIREDQI